MSRFLAYLGVLFFVTLACCTQVDVTAQGPSAQHLEGLTVRSLLADGNVLLAGTSGGAGIYRSVNAGETWTEYGSGVSTRDVTAIIRRGSDLFAATWGGGVYRRSDSDATWTQVNQGLGSPYIWSLAVSRDSTHVYALAPYSGVYQLRTGSGRWEAVSIRGLPLSDSTAGLFLFVDKGDRLFAGIANASATNPGIYRYDGGNDRWLPAGRLPDGVSARGMGYTPDGALWVGTSAGLYHLKSGQLERLWGTGNWNVTALKDNPGYSDALLIGLGTGQIHALIGAPGRWQMFKPNDIAVRVRDFAALQTEPWRVFVATDNGVYTRELPPVVLTARSTPDASTTLQSGQIITYTIEYSNVTDISLTSLYVEFAIPGTGLEYLDGGTWLEAEKKAFWRVGTVPAHGSARLIVRAQVSDTISERAIALVSDGAGGVWMSAGERTRTGIVRSNKVLNWKGRQPFQQRLPYIAIDVSP